ncbi:Cyclin-T2 [Fasciola gigantica]|uniref:Cyclin-T2 n=1 Tax=Fasciola gigantica TaxID=46835 RepID=A0A504X8I0_FASGI|nr:Cyclin-T2 [Fasciola gigantica]
MEQCQAERKLHLARRQQCACLIQEIGSRVQTTQVVINAGIYYMHHFYEVFSPETIKPILVAIAAFYCACKTEDFSRKLSHLIRATYDILKRPVPSEDSEIFKRLVQNIHALEATILMVIGFQTLEVKQPHVYLINAIRANKFPKEISHTSYYICTNILHLTTLILRHSAEAIAAASLYIAAKWNAADIQSANGGEWFHIFSPDLTFDEISKITEEFTRAFQECDLKIREQLRTSLRVCSFCRADGLNYTMPSSSLQSRKLQREQKEEMAKRPIADSTQTQKPDSGKIQADKRPYSSTSGMMQPAPHPHVAAHHHSRVPHPNQIQTNSVGASQPFHGHHRSLPPGHVGPVGGGVSVSSHPSTATGAEHFHRPSASRPQPPNAAPEPDSKRPRLDRSYPSGGRHSPVSHVSSGGQYMDSSGRSARYDGNSYFGQNDSAMRHSTNQGGAPPGRPDYRMMPSTGYNSMPTKPLGREDSRAGSRPSTNQARFPSKPGAHIQANSRPPIVGKHDLNDYF